MKRDMTFPVSNVPQEHTDHSPINDTPQELADHLDRIAAETAAFDEQEAAFDVLMEHIGTIDTEAIIPLTTIAPPEIERPKVIDIYDPTVFERINNGTLFDNLRHIASPIFTRERARLPTASPAEAVRDELTETGLQK